MTVMILQGHRWMFHMIVSKLGDGLGRVILQDEGAISILSGRLGEKVRRQQSFCCSCRRWRGVLHLQDFFIFNTPRSLIFTSGRVERVKNSL